MKKLLTTYLKSISDQTSQGDSREESYYDSLKTLFSDFPLEKGRKTHVTVLPRGTEAGNPDFRIWDGDHFIVGYIEAKLPGTNLDQVATSEQLQRYLSTFPNLILTDFYEFRLYRDGKEICRAQIGLPFVSQKLKTTPPLTNADQFQHLADLFFSFKLPVRYTAESLAIDLAKRTRFLRDQVIREELKQEESQKGELFGFYQAFKKYLLPNLSSDDFADLYAQTIAYSLFAARTRVEGDFHRKIAVDYIPHTTGILRDVFRYLSLGSMSLEMEVTVDDIAAVLNAAEIKSILDQYYKDGKGEDPIIHFYETFLNQYDPQTRESRGVYYTPEPVVKYIVRSVHEVLKRDFNLPDGLADENVTLLDPAAGTLTFPAEAIKLAVGEYVDKYGEGGKDGFIRKHILRDFYAFELMMAPYAIGHMKIGYLLESLGYKMGDDDAFKLYLTNTLEMEEIAQSELPGVASLSEESRLAGKVKRDPILVILGNPPYSGISSNINDWTENLLKTDLDGAQSYYKVDGKPLGEKKLWLQDDYVKFLRFAQWKIQKAGKGIVAMITNHAWLDNPTFRGMRQSLLQTFNNIYVLDLHGSTLKKEASPDGSKDENVFDIRTGVAITVFVKTNDVDMNVKIQDLYGSRDKKYSFLENNSIARSVFQDSTPKKPHYFFTKKDFSNIEHYQDYPTINQIFPTNVTGIVTARDKFSIDMDVSKLKRRIIEFRNQSLTDEIIVKAYGLKNSRGWNLSQKRVSLSKDEMWENRIKPICYRPFDVRNVFYSPDLIDWGRENTMPTMLKQNLAISTVRQVKTGETWQHALIADGLVESCYISNRTSEICTIYPLYMYKDKSKLDLFSSQQEEKGSNISSAIMDMITTTLSHKMTPEMILYYVYAVLYSTSYRDTYAEFLKIDYPRIPFTANPELFMQMANLGERLANLHLLKSDELNQPLVKYQGEGGNQIIERPIYNAEEKRLYINKNYYFENLEPEVWTYQIGGYQVMDKYLKDRKGQTLEDPRHLIRVATALAKTIEIQEEIDALYGGVEENLISFD